MEATDRTLHGSRCLIIGYGRIGRLLADRLLSLGAEVTVSARKYGDSVRKASAVPKRVSVV